MIAPNRAESLAANSAGVSGRRPREMHQCNPAAGPGPSKEELKALAALEEDAGNEYRALRAFVRTLFD